MARYVDAIDLPVPVEKAFDYLADFSRTAEWDPGVVEAERLTAGPIGVGSRFRVVVAFCGARIPLEYEIAEFERPHRVVFSGGDASVHSVDEVTFAPRPGGTRVTYEARLHLAGIRRLADPLLDLLFQRIGRLAVRGLRERMAAERSPARARTAAAGASRAPGSSTRPRKRTKGVRRKAAAASRAK